MVESMSRIRIGRLDHRQSSGAGKKVQLILYLFEESQWQEDLTLYDLLRAVFHHAHAQLHMQGILNVSMITLLKSDLSIIAKLGLESQNLLSICAPFLSLYHVCVIAIVGAFAS